MANTYTNILRTCEKCLERVKLYIVCFKCDLTYHPNCWRKLPGAYLNEKGHAFCCWDITSNQYVSAVGGFKAEVIIEEEYDSEYNDVSGNCQLKEEDFQNKQKLSEEPLHLQHIKTECKNTLIKGITVEQDGELKKYSCADCKYITHKKRNLDRHIRIHTNNRPFECPYKNCICIAGQEESCKCHMCRYASITKQQLKEHILTKHSVEPRKYQCTDCNYITHRKPDLTQHIRIHTNDRPFKCTFKNCSCTEGQEESCKCDTCGYAALRKWRLKEHILAKHNLEPKNYKCADCKYATHRKDHLQRHMRRHNNVRLFKCSYKNCECIAGQEESCKCDMCGYTAVTKQQINEHILTEHSTKAKKYKCADCKYITYKKGNLERHIHTHTNKRSA